MENGTRFKNCSDVNKGSDAKGSNLKNNSRQYLTFRVARMDLALDAGRVRAILPLADMAPMRSGRAGVIGIVNLAGSPVVVVDLQVRLALSIASTGAKHTGAKRRIVVVAAAGGHLAGFLVDRVTDVVRYRSRDLRKGVLHGIGRARRVLEVDGVVEEDDLVRLWSVSS